MPELLLELFSEEIPARMQEKAAEDLLRLITDGLKEARLEYKTAQSFVTPRRLTVVVDGLPKQQPDLSVERKGPRVGAPEAALEGFLKSTGLTREQLEIRGKDKDATYFATIHQKGVATAEALVPILEKAMRDLPWPKSMRWGSHAVRWVRPLHSILCLFDGAVASVKFGHVQAGQVTFGHRFLAPGEITVKDSKDYAEKLRKACVIIDPEERKELIRAKAQSLAAEQELFLKRDEGLLAEVAGLVEWPEVLMGTIEDRFTRLPEEVLVLVMKHHQRYFALHDSAGKLAARFMLVANIRASDGGAHIIVGNERVLRARFSDALFFWDHDRKTPLESRLPELEKVVFHAKLGTLAEKVERITSLAKLLAVWVPHANLTLVERAAQLAKADLVSGTVGELPELQGVMGRYYAMEQKEPQEVADAICDHYSPAGPNDACPKAPVSVCVALADKLDTLAGMFAAGEKPTGSKDPFALRRAALGVLRLVLENGLRVKLSTAIEAAAKHYPPALFKETDKDDVAKHVLEFMAERLKVMLKDSGIRHDVIAAVFDSGAEDDFVRLVLRAKALQEFLGTEDGANLLAAYRRAANIVKIESKKDGEAYTGAPKEKLLKQEEEKRLFAAIEDAREAIAKALEAEDFAGAMRALACLRAPVDAFFDKVTVNCDERDVRENRLKLLVQVQTGLDALANFAVVEGGEAGKAMQKAA